MKNSIFSFHGSLDFIYFAYRYFFPNEDLRWTWELHGGASGHIAYTSRRSITEDVQNRLFKNFEAHSDELQDKMDQIVNVSHIIQRCLALSREGTVNQADLPKEIHYCLATGFARSGGTYLYNQLGKMFNVDNEANGLFWGHDFYPHFSLASYNSKDQIKQFLTSSEVVYHLATIIAHLVDSPENAFIKRTVLGGSAMPFLATIAQFQRGLMIHHRHIIRDINGIIPSIEKMYAGKEDDGFDNVYGVFEGVEDAFLVTATKWFIANLSILPTTHGLPFIDLPIDFSSIESVISQVTKVSEKYLKNSKKVKGVEYVVPKVIKYGSSAENQLQHDAINGADTIIPEKLNYSSKPEVDTPFQAVYDCYLNVLTRLYQHVGIDFDGRLEKV